VIDRAADLRAEFDRGFAAPVVAADSAPVDLLLVRAGGVAYAIARTDITGLHADLAIVAMPTRAPELLGLATIRNAVVPVYALDRIVGSTHGEASPRWLVVTHTVALAFEGFDGYRRVPNLPAAQSSGHLRGVIDIDGDTRPILDLDSVLATITRRVPAAKER